MAGGRCRRARQPRASAAALGGSVTLSPAGRSAALFAPWAVRAHAAQCLRAIGASSARHRARRRHRCGRFADARLSPRGHRWAASPNRSPHRRDDRRGAGGARRPCRAHPRPPRLRLHRPESCRRSSAAACSPRLRAPASARAAGADRGAVCLPPRRAASARCARCALTSFGVCSARAHRAPLAIARDFRARRGRGAANRRHALHRGRRARHRAAPHCATRHGRRVHRRGPRARCRERHDCRRAHRVHRPVPPRPPRPPRHPARRVARRGPAGHRRAPCARARPPALPATARQSLRARARPQTTSSAMP